MSHQRMKQAEEREQAEIARILAEMEKVNTAEDDDHGGLPAELLRGLDRRDRGQWPAAPG